MPKIKISLWQIAIEFLSVVFAVLLALGLNSYKSNSDLEDEADLLSRKIIKELKKNQLELDTVLTRNKEFKAYVDSLRAVDTLPESLELSFASRLLTKSAWDFTKASRSFSYLDEDLLEEAAALYERQDYYMHISNQMFQNLAEMLMTDPAMERTLIMSNYFLLNLNSAGDNLADSYKDFLDQYGD